MSRQMRFFVLGAFVLAFAALASAYGSYGFSYSSRNFNAYYYSYGYPAYYYPDPCCGSSPVIYAPLRYPYYTPPINPHHNYYAPAYRAPAYSPSYYESPYYNPPSYYAPTDYYGGCLGYWNCGSSPSTTYFADSSYSGPASGYYGSAGSYYSDYPSYTYTRSFGYSFE